jgi:hypothetical protein
MRYFLASMHSTSREDLFIIQQLLETHRQISFQFKINLKVPVMLLVDLDAIWGRWDPLKRTIEINRRLVHSYSWNVVLYVLKHEMAHQIVSEIYQQDDVPHGDWFKKACELLRLPPEFQKGSGPLIDPGQNWKDEGAKSETVVAVLKKIEKLFSLAQGTNEAEAAVAISKAQELLKKYNIDQDLYVEQAQKFRYSIYDTGKQRLSPLYSHMAGLLINYYNVDVVFSDTVHSESLKKTQVLEIYGRETNVLIAEYVFDFLWRSLEHLWKSYQQLHSCNAKLKTSFQLGVLSGFQKKLETSKEYAESSETVSGGHGKSIQNLKSLLKKEDKERHVFIQKRHPRLRSRRSGRTRLDKSVFDSGFLEGQDIQINKAVTSIKKKRHLLFGSIL